MQQSNPLAALVNLVSTVKQANPKTVFDRMMQSNPQFANFMQQNQGKTPEQIAQENGIDFNNIRRLIG